MRSSIGRSSPSTAEETTNDCETWSKTTAQPRRLATGKESRNAVVKQRLAGGKWAVAAYLGVGEKAVKGDGSFGHRLPL
jgi:hypothetical protein